MMKKFFAAAAILLVGLISAFADDTSDVDLQVVPFGQLSRADFDNTFKEDVSDDVAGIVEQIFDENDKSYLYVSDIEPIDEDELGDYMTEICRLAKTQIPAKAKANSEYLGFGTLEFSEEEETLYGYILFMHYKSKSDVKIYTYLYAAEIDWNE